jgi:hypothetical protein
MLAGHFESVAGPCRQGAIGAKLACWRITKWPEVDRPAQTVAKIQDLLTKIA